MFVSLLDMKLSVTFPSFVNQFFLQTFLLVLLCVGKMVKFYLLIVIICKSTSKYLDFRTSQITIFLQLPTNHMRAHTHIHMRVLVDCNTNLMKHMQVKNRLNKQIDPLTSIRRKTQNLRVQQYPNNDLVVFKTVTLYFCWFIVNVK